MISKIVVDVSLIKFVKRDRDALQYEVGNKSDFAAPLSSTLFSLFCSSS
jgi:hypothetical protein